jgi:predicted nucleic acid-binding protein
VKFWDASAIIPLILDEAGNDAVRVIRLVDRDFTVWWGTRVECFSALTRRLREGTLPENRFRGTLDRLRVIFGRADEISPNEDVRVRAERMLRAYPLRAADSLQLSAAVSWADDRPAGLEFVCLDERLRDAAEREGFTVLPS